MTAPPEATAAAIPLAHAALCIDCDCVIDTRILRDQKARTCRAHTWVRLSRWLPAINENEENGEEVDDGNG